MANVNKVNGFRPVSTLTGAPWNGQITQYAAVTGDATIIAVGDLVALGGTTGVGEYAGYRGVRRAAASDAIVGVCVGFSVNPSNLDTPQVRAASTARWVMRMWLSLHWRHVSAKGMSANLKRVAEIDEPSIRGDATGG
jgi:hypothetical protein